MYGDILKEKANKMKQMLMKRSQESKHVQIITFEAVKLQNI